MRPDAPAMAVVTKTREKVSGAADKTEPPLKPNQPNQRRKTLLLPREIMGAKLFSLHTDLDECLDKGHLLKRPSHRQSGQGLIQQGES